MASLAAFEPGPEVWKTNDQVAYRGRDPVSGAAVLVKTSRRRLSASPDAAHPLRRECELSTRLPGDLFPACVDSFDHDGGWCTVLPWFAGRPLRDVRARRPLPVDEALLVVGGAALLLDHLHARRWVHGSLSPDSLLWCGETRVVRLADLGVVVTDDMPTAMTPLSLDLPFYAAPERGSPDARSVDYRADIYSLGVILYELLTGSLPFFSDDPAALARMHSAAPLPRPDEERVPVSLWSVIERCLQKLPTDRYRSAGGLRADLERYREASHGGPVGTAFPVGTDDVPSQLVLSQTLHGREAQCAELERRYRAAANGAAELVLIRGVAGVGKTVLANALRETAKREAGTFIAGKFGRHQTEQPYTAIVDALRELVAPMLSASGEDLTAWRRDLERRLGRNAHVIGAVLPELGFPPPAPLPPKESRNRFVATFVAFLRECVGESPPLVLFLDDLQWMDGGSWELLHALLETPDIERLLVVGAFRSDEVEPGSALENLLGRQGAHVTHIPLQPLSEFDVQGWLADTLHCAREATSGLARAVSAKTLANPFFMARFMESLYATGHVRYVPGTRRWHWDEAAIARMTVTDNVVRLMVDKLRRYPLDLVQGLCTIACLGGSVSGRRLAQLLGLAGTEEVDRLLAPATADGVLLREPGEAPDERDETPASPATTAPVPVALATGTGYRFSHDKVEEAAYELLEPDAREQLHLSIGRHLLKEERVRGDDIFLVTSQYDRWLARHVLQEEDDMVAALYVEAGRRARAGNAHEAARQCFQRADTLLRDASWQTDKVVVVRLLRDWAETEYVLGDFKRSRRLINRALDLYPGDVDKARLRVLLIDMHTADAEYPAAIDAGRTALADLGFEGWLGRPFPGRRVEGEIEAVLEAELDATARHPVGSFEAKLMHAGEPEDARLGAIMAVLMSLIPPSYFVDRKLNALVATFMARLTYEKEFVCESTAKGISNFGNALAEERGMYREGYELAQLALRFAAERYESMVPRIQYALAGSLNHWVKHLAHSEDDIESGIRVCEKYGERDYNGYLRTLARCQNGIYLGRSLAAFKDKVAESIAFVERARNALGLRIARSVHAAICELDGSSLPPADDDTPADEREDGADDDADTRLIRCIVAVLRMQGAVFLRRPDTARQALDEAVRLETYLSTEMTLPMLHLFGTLVLLDGMAGAKPVRDADRRLERVRGSLERLRGWAADCPQNFAHASLLAEGALAMVEGRVLDAVKAFSSAADLAAENGYRQFEGLAHEYLARCWSRENQPRYAAEHARAAATAYEAWGATRVLQRLRAEYPSAARAPAPPAAPDHADGLPVDVYRETFAATVDLLAGARPSAPLAPGAARQMAMLAGAARCRVYAPTASRPALVASSSPQEEPDAAVLGLVMRAARTREVVSETGEDGRSAVLAIPVVTTAGVAAVACLENPLGALAPTPRLVGLLRALTLIATGDEHASLNKLSRFLPGHVAAAVRAREDESREAVVREEIGIAFFDLRRFTAFHTSVEPEEGRRLLAEYRRTVGMVVREHGGTTDHWEGDGCMVFIAAPVPVEQRIERVVRMAVSMRERSRELIATWNASGHRLGFGIGIACGYTDHGILGTEERWDYSATGRYVSLASRLCDEARDGQILVTDAVHAAVGDHHPMQLVAEREISGFAHPVRIYDVVG